MVFLNGFGLEVLVRGTTIDKFTREGGKYFALEHGDEYQIQLSNTRNTLCEVHLEIDGEDVGTFRIPRRGLITLERPANRQKKFTFVREDSTLARRTGVEAGLLENGLIRAVFYPKKEIIYETLAPTEAYGEMIPEYLSTPRGLTSSSLASSQTNLRTSQAPQARMMRAPQYESGATILGRDSSQRFGLVEKMDWRDIDQANVTTIEVRLVAKTTTYQPLRSHHHYNYQRETPYPDRIDDY